MQRELPQYLRRRPTWKEAVELARTMTFEEKFLAGPRMFEIGCRILADDVKEQHPEADDEMIQSLVHERVELIKRLEKSGFMIYWPLDPIPGS